MTAPRRLSTRQTDLTATRHALNVSLLSRRNHLRDDAYTRFIADAKPCGPVLKRRVFHLVYGTGYKQKIHKSTPV